MVLRFRCAAARPACLPPCHRMAACPTASSPSPLPNPESQIARRQRSDRGEHNCMRAVHAGVTDYRLNAPEIAIGRPLLVENRPCEVCAAWSPQWKKKKSYLRRLVVHACCVPCASQGYHGDPHALENPWVCCLCAGCQKPKTPYPPLALGGPGHVRATDHRPRRRHAAGCGARAGHADRNAAGATTVRGATPCRRTSPDRV